MSLSPALLADSGLNAAGYISARTMTAQAGQDDILFVFNAAVFKGAEHLVQVTTVVLPFPTIDGLHVYHISGHAAFASDHQKQP